MLTRPVWAEISRSRLLANYQRLRQLAGADADLMAVVKANAYGHDVQQCAPLLAQAGAPWLGVTSTDEGAAVRAVCPQPRILLMSGMFAGEAETVVDRGLTPVVWEHWQLDLLEAAAKARGVRLAVHLEIDTGMARQGVREAEGLLHRFGSGGWLELEGIMTHFCAPENFSSTQPNPQLARMEKALSSILRRGLHPTWLHAGNSSTLVAGNDRGTLLEMAARAGMRLMVRPGLALYGYLDHFHRDGVRWCAEETFAPVLSWKTRISSLRTLQAGESAGYGHTFTAMRETRLALLPMGYADGLNRLLSNRGRVLVGGEYAPIAGRVSMDQTIVDVTEIPHVALGDEVVLLGNQGERSIDAWDLADLCGTIPWEVLCAISERVPRVLTV